MHIIIIIIDCCSEIDYDQMYGTHSRRDVLPLNVVKSTIKPNQATTQHVLQPAWLCVRPAARCEAQDVHSIHQAPLAFICVHDALKSFRTRIVQASSAFVPVRDGEGEAYRWGCLSPSHDRRPSSPLSGRREPCPLLPVPPPSAATFGPASKGRAMRPHTSPLSGPCPSPPATPHGSAGAAHLPCPPPRQHCKHLSAGPQALATAESTSGAPATRSQASPLSFKHQRPWSAVSSSVSFALRRPPAPVVSGSGV